MKRSILVILTLFVALSATAQVYSSNSGGAWSDPATWVGSALPGDTDAVVIRGTVSMDMNDTVGAITIESGAVLQNASNWYYTLSVSGSVSISGSLRDNPAGNRLYLYVGGDISVFGTWSNTKSHLNGSGSQQVLEAAGATCTSELENLKPDGNIVAASDMTLQNVFDLNGGTLDLGSNDLLVGDGAYLYAGRVLTTGSIRQSNPNRSFAEHVTFVGTSTVSGVVSFGTDLTFEGTLINDGTIQNSPAWYYYVHVTGDVVNNGTIRNHPASNRIYFRVTGDLTNNGTWANEHIYLTGDGTQKLSQSAGTTWDAPIESLKEAGYTYAGSDLDFSRVVDMNSDSLYVGTHNLTVRGAGNLYTVHAFTDGSLTQVDASGPATDWSSFTGSLTIRNTVNLGYDTTVNGNLTVADTLQGWSGWYYTLFVNGTFTNNGTLRNSPNGQRLYVSARGDLVNNGVWTPERTYLDGAGDQTLSQSAGTTWSMPIESRKETGYTYAGSNLDFSNLVDMNSDSLYVGSRNLTVRGLGQLSEANTFIDGDFSQYDAAAPAANYTLFSGSTTIRNTVNLAYDITFEGLITVEDTLQAWSSWYFSTYINGGIVNNGTIRNNPSGRQLYVRAAGNLTNNGTWSNERTFLTGMGEQTIAQADGISWLSPIESLKETGYTYASSDLDFSRVLDMNYDSLYVGARNIVVREHGQLLESTVFIEGDLTQYDAAVPALQLTQVVGTAALRETVHVANDVVFRGSVVIEDTLQAWSSWFFYLTVDGDVVNNGTIRNHPNGRQLFLYVSGDLSNRGIWSPERTYLSGPGNQTISQSDAVSFGGPIESLKETGYTYADSDLDFSNLIDMNGDSLYVGAHDVVVRGHGKILESSIFIDGSLSQFDPLVPAASYSVFSGSTTIRETVNLEVNNRFEGTLTVVDTLQNWGSWYQTAFVDGDLDNQGTIRNNPAGHRLYLHVTGDVIGGGELSVDRVYLNGDGPRTWNAPSAQTVFDVNGGVISLFGDNVLPNLEINTDPGPTLASGASLRILDGGVDGALVNYGQVHNVAAALGGGTYPMYRTTVRLAAEAFDSLRVVHFGNQTPGSYGNAVKSFWRLETVPSPSSLTLEWIDLGYDDEQLGSNNEYLLEVYVSYDEGATWRQRSTSAFLERFPESNYVRLHDAPANGLFVLSSHSDNVAVMPSIVPSIIGRSQIRVGPPNRYTVHYANNSDIATGDVVMKLETSEGVHIHHIEPSAPAGATPEFLYPEDFAIYFDSTAAPPDTVAFLYIANMAPHEERSFDVVLTAIPDAAGKLYGADGTEILPVIGVVVSWAAAGLTTAYLSDLTFNLVEETFASSASEPPGFILSYAIEKTNNRWLSFEKPMTELVKDLALTWGQGILGGALGTAAVVGVKLSEGLFKFFTAVLCGGDRWLNNGVQAIDECRDKPVNKVTSWDPNEKVGPDGAGPDGFVTDASLMTYQILFENKAQATAPAWKIVIDDTLSSAFDPSTVVFEGASHEGFELTIDEDVLHWEITGVELPPNVNPPEGEGYVQFSVRPFEGLDSGTALRNRAAIVFDLNEPILTNEVLNTVDFRAPVTVMDPLPDELPGDPVAVRWTALDGAGESGVTSTRLFMSVDGGGFTSLGSTSADSMMVDVDPNHVYAFYALSQDAVGNTEAVRPELVTVTVVSGVAVEPDPEVPFVFALNPAYPNPFNPVATITYSLPVAGPAQLIVFDAVGRRVATLVDGDMAAGNHVVSWDAGRFASGAYFYRLMQGARNETRAMILMK